jgi:hypothetical protein
MQVRTTIEIEYGTVSGQIDEFEIHSYGPELEDLGIDEVTVKRFGSDNFEPTTVGHLLERYAEEHELTDDTIDDVKMKFMMRTGMKKAEDEIMGIICEGVLEACAIAQEEAAIRNWEDAQDAAYSYVNP